MKRFSFGTFLVDDANRQAFEACLDVANLKSASPRPVILLGATGTGKTHLLYSIVNRTRTGSSRTGIAYVTAGDFPLQVRALAKDPVPVEQAEAAILLIDHLERFEHGLEDLEAVARIFLDNGHYVVFATDVHPERLEGLTQGLRAMLDQGSISEILPQSPSGRLESLERRLREESDALLAQQRRQMAELQAQLEGKDTELSRVTSQLEHLQGEYALFSVTQREVGPLREKMEALQSQFDETRAELAHRKSLDGEVDALHVQLKEARTESRVAREEANALLSRAETLLDEVQKGRMRFAEAQHEQNEQIQEIRRLEAALTGDDVGIAEGEIFEAAGPADAGAVTDSVEASAVADGGEASAATGEATRARGHLEEEHEELRTELEKVSLERDRIREESVTMAAKYAEAQAMVSQALAEIDGLEQATDQREKELNAVREQLAQAFREKEEREREAETMREQSEGLKEGLGTELQGLREALRKRDGEADAIRREAQEQGVSARLKVRDMERQLDAVVSERDALLRVQGTMIEGLIATKARLGEAAESIGPFLAGRPGEAANAIEPGSGGDSSTATAPMESEAIVVTPAEESPTVSDDVEGDSVILVQDGDDDFVLRADLGAKRSSIHHVEQLEEEMDIFPDGGRARNAPFPDFSREVFLDSSGDPSI